MGDLSGLASESKHLVVICGGAVAGSEAALACAERGILAVVIEQNPRPFGKIEDGLPRWHYKLRDKEYARIGANLQAPGVYYVPCTRLGRDISLEEVEAQWQPSAVLLATGAWRDRPLPIEGIDAYIDRGLVYQNPFVYWFNHYPEPGYRGPHYRCRDGAIVIGGGLASIDVAKIINLELYAQALAARGIEMTTSELEHRGIPAALATHGLEPNDLGVRGCTLYYRRRKQDMPLANAPAGATPEQLAKVEQVRVKVMDNVMRKYLVRFEPCHVPVGAVVEDDRLVGIRWRRTVLEGGRLREIEDSDYEVRSELIVSSIGSVPEPLPGIPQRGELYAFADWQTGAIEDMSGVFGLGNVLTGQGNIKDSRVNARDVSSRVLEGYLGLAPEAATPQELSDLVHGAAHEATALSVESAVRQVPLRTRSQLSAVAQRIELRWQQVGYAGDYASWIERSWPGAPT